MQFRKRFGRGLVGTLNGIAAAGPGFRSSRELPCVFETSKIIPLTKETEIVRLNVRLLLSATGPEDAQRSPPEHLPPDNIPSFIVHGSSADMLHYADEDTDMLDCRISPYFPADTQIGWPGREIGASSSDSWFTCTITHAAGKYAATAFLVQDQKERENPNPGQLLPGPAEQLHVSEKPIVTVNVNSLSLVEGEQHKLVCDIRHYYPHNIQVQWLREPKDSWKVPDVMKNVLSSSHRQSSNGTYSSSRYFLLTASLKDNGHKYTCLVDHPSLQAPIRRSVTVEVREATPAAWLLLLLLGLAVCLVGALWCYRKGKITSGLPNLGCGEGRTLLWQPSPRLGATALPRLCAAEPGYRCWEMEAVLHPSFSHNLFFSLFPCPSEEHCKGRCG
ncbi:uncharacterized protein J5M81_012524, partial [Pluvialis apricaria]